MTSWMLLTWVGMGSAAAQDVDFECTPGNSGGVVGLPPLEVTCSVIPPEDGTFDAVTWTFGDGSVVKGETVGFTYEEVGRYTVTVQLENFADPNDPNAGDPQKVRHEFVTVCGAPEPSFELVNLGGFDYEFANTSLVAPRCLFETVWTVFDGRGGEGEPIFTSAVWQPKFTFPGEGSYTVRLEQKGLAGDRALQQSVPVEYGVSDELRRLDPYGCSIAPPVVAFGSLGLVVVAALIRRRP